MGTLPQVGYSWDRELRETVAEVASGGLSIKFKIQKDGGGTDGVPTNTGRKI